MARTEGGKENLLIKVNFLIIDSFVFIFRKLLYLLIRGFFLLFLLMNSFVDFPDGNLLWSFSKTTVLNPGRQDVCEQL